MEPQQRKISRIQHLCYSIGHVQNDICASMWFTYLVIFFQTVLQWPRTVAGIIMLIGQVADALSTPFVGLQADLRDDFWMCRYGRRKTWHLVGTLCVLLSFPFIFMSCIGCRDAAGDYWYQLVYFGAFICIFQFGWAAVQISHLSLIPDLTPDQNARTGLIACRYTFTVMSNVFVYVLAWGVFHVTSESHQMGPSDKPGFQIIVMAGLGVGIACSILFHMVVKEVPNTPVLEQHPAQAEGVNSSITPVREQKTVKEHIFSLKFYQIAAVYMSTRLFANLSQVLTPLYLHEQGFGAESLAVVPLVMFLSSFCTSFIVKAMNKHMGRKIAYFVGCVIGTGGCIWILLGAGKLYTTYEVHAVAVLLGASSSIQLVTSLGLTADLIGIDTHTGAFVYGAMSFVDKMSNGVAVAILQAYFSHDYRRVFAYVCGGATILGSLSVGSLSLNCRRKALGSTLLSDEDARFESSYNEI